MKKISPEKTRLKPELKLADEAFDLRNLDTNIIIEQLEHNMVLRETPIPKQVQQKLKRAGEEKSFTQQ